MRLWHLRIERFRAIQHLEWNPRGRLLCLVGAGDQGKTTVLDAVGSLASTRSGPFTESDFFGGCATDGSIEIEGVFGDLPAALLADNRFGMDLVGVDQAGGTHEEPAEHQPAVRLRLDVDGTLEPVWRLLSARNPDGRPLTARDRAALKVARVGMDPDRQFHLGRTSALLGLVSDPADVAEIVEIAYSAARAAVRDTDMSTLGPTVAAAARIGVAVGAGPAVDQLSIGLELSRTSGSGLSLQASGIPVRAAGLGTRRLLAVGLELGSAETGALVCLDEVEHGLEPHRIKHLVRTLGKLVEPKVLGGPGGQVMFTSHSPVVLGELGAVGIAVVRTVAGETDIQPVPLGLNPVIRATPEALLGRSAIIAEGKTEIGFVRAHDHVWTPEHDGQSLGYRGVAVVDGGGQSAAGRALGLASLGYPTLLLVDADKELDPPVLDLEGAGVEVVQWDDNMCSEERILADLSWNGVEQAFQVVVDTGHDPSAVVQAIVGGKVVSRLILELDIDRTVFGDTLQSLVDAGLPEVGIRSAFAAAAKRSDKAWFKRIDTGEAIGRIAASDPTIAATPFGQAMARVETWCHG